MRARHPATTFAGRTGTPSRVVTTCSARQDLARAPGDAVIVVDKFASDKAFLEPNSGMGLVPCAAETRRTTCVECRLCLDVDLLERNVAIAFEAHGLTARLARSALVELRMPEQSAVSSKPRRAT